MREREASLYGPLDEKAAIVAKGPTLRLDHLSFLRHRRKTAPGGRDHASRQEAGVPLELVQ